MTKRQEKAAIKKVLSSGTFVLPVHDYPARLEHGRVVARLGQAVPGPETPLTALRARPGTDATPMVHA
jgi:hypothetical protein